MSIAFKILKYVVAPIVAGIIVYFVTQPLSYKHGFTAGWEKGYQDGIAKGKEDGREIGYREGFDEGKQDGIEEGIEKGRKHSILKFMDVYKENLDEMARALSLVEQGENSKILLILKSSALATVENVNVWRGVQDNFKELLDGQIDDLEIALQRDDYQRLRQIIRTLQQTYAAKRLAVETELAKSKI